MTDKLGAAPSAGRGRLIQLQAASWSVIPELVHRCPSLSATSAPKNTRVGMSSVVPCWQGQGQGCTPDDTRKAPDWGDSFKERAQAVTFDHAALPPANIPRSWSSSKMRC